MRDIRDEIRAIYEQRATRRYGLSAVNQQQHALQSAALAEKLGEPPALIVAALVHDIGHMVHTFGEDPAGQGIDDHHEERGAQWLEARFSADVVEPVRLHVPAKRYLCAVDPTYFAKLAPDSVRSLSLQGGPMNPDEVGAFERLPHAQAAVRLRRIDEAAKTPNAQTPSVEHFLGYVDQVLAAVTPAEDQH
jgi:[1-hydroxy-2-(trimethylamino)ethyl]phosphonate dioxygenase